MRRVVNVLVVALVVVGCGETRNEAVCCVSAEDCAAIGADVLELACGEGLACRDHKCEVASCSTNGCSAEAPVCNVATDTCEGCSSSSDCAQFVGAMSCDSSNGVCVECLVSNDCPVDRAICDDHACRGCELDADCASGACDEAMCVSEDRIAYVIPSGGSDAGSCTRVAPCATIQYAVTKTSSVVRHIVVAAGTYDQDTRISTAETSAPEVTIHGTGATLTRTSGESEQFFVVNVKTTLVGLFFGPTENTNSAIQCEDAPCRLRRIRLQRLGSIFPGPMMEIEDSDLDFILGSGVTLNNVTDSVKITRTRLRGFVSGTGGVIDITNTMVLGEVSLPTGQGTIQFSTLATSGGAGTGIEPRVVKAGPGVTLRDSIVWAGGTTQLPLGGGCTVTNSIVGPTAVPGASNVDPQFVSFSDFHLSANSPARDMASTGPGVDFEGEPRPVGAGFDLGADEVQ